MFSVSVLLWVARTIFPADALASSSANHLPRRPLVLYMVDPLAFAAALDTDLGLEFGVAVVSAAAGVISQLPRIQSLERELQATKSALSASEADLVEKVQELEEKLFVMDQEFEEQTVRFQRQYDRTQKDQMEVLKEKLKTEMSFKLEIQLAQERSAKLMEQVANENGRTAKQEELLQMKLKQAQLADMNRKLEQALESTDAELQRMRSEAAGGKKKFVFW